MTGTFPFDNHGDRHLSIDLGCGGVGDRHIDILWGIWTLKFNLGTGKYADRFMDAYGKEMIDPEMLRMVAAMEMIRN